ncbi:MAG TPA: ATPase, T2SS/T4P/T4SS family [Planctomycetota bacterium]|nr:ATPase, T2SS/T4P/T4SS family [Planctomycetota bacterium]
MERSAPEVLEELVRCAEAGGASDIHLHRGPERTEVAFRLDGCLARVEALPDELARHVFGRIKYLARLKTYQESLPQEGRIEKANLGARSDVRVATYPTVTGEKIVLRLFSSCEVLALEQLGLRPDARAALEGFLARPAGTLLLTGPAGSGKTTTIYACLQHLAARTGRHIITIEDPVEQVVPGVMQTEVNPAVGLDFAKAARHLLRQDPQVLVLGEIRDEETANLALRAAFTGHMVISTLHAGSCRGVFERLFGMCDDRYAAIAAVEMILNQRLVRKLCPQCGGEGCDACLRTGYRGRVPAVEWLALDESLRARLREQGAAAAAPTPPLEAEGRRLVAQGITNEAEYARVFGP